jgi:hypothetical protein
MVTAVNLTDVGNTNLFLLYFTCIRNLKYSTRYKKLTYNFLGLLLNYQTLSSVFCVFSFVNLFVVY